MKTLGKHLTNIRKKGSHLVVPYIMAGDGGLDKLVDELMFLQEKGVSAIEVGIPFSDPVADGPVIQDAGLRALNANVTLTDIINKLKNTSITIPLVIMSYLNPIYHYGIEKFISDLSDTPVKGLIIPDMPFEHTDMITEFLSDSDISLIPLVSLTSSKERMQLLVDNAEGFIYAITVNGTTGERVAFDSRIEDRLDFLSSISEYPVLAGFGISEKEHVMNFDKHCDGVIIGSKIVNMLHLKQQDELANFLSEIISL